MTDITLDSVAEGLKSKMDETFAVKADKTEVEAVKSALDEIKIPSLEGYVKQEQHDEVLKELKNMKESHDQLEATVAAAPAITKGYGDVEYKPGFEWVGEHGKSEANVDLTKFINGTYTKAENDNTNVANSPVDAAAAFWTGVQSNPLRAISTNLPVSTGSVYLPSITGITASAEASVPSSIDTSSGHGGALGSERQLVLQKWTSRTLFSDVAVEDIPGLDPMIAAFQANQIGQAEATDHVSNLNGNSDVTEVNTGQAAALPDGIDEWASLVSSLSSYYKPNARFVLSREALESLRTLAQQGTGSPLVIDPSTGQFRLWGYEIVVNDHFDAGNAANQNPVYFGDFAQGSIIATNRQLNVSRHEDTIPGGVYYYGTLRSRGTVWNPAALVRFNVAA